MSEKQTSTKNLKATDSLEQIFMLAWPVMVGMVLQSLLSTVDTWFISQLGKSQSASAGLGNSASGVIFVISSLVSAGTIALVARSFGEKDMDSIRKFNGESIVLSFIIGGILSLICYFNTIPIIKLMFNPNAKITAMTNEFLSIMFLGTVLVFLNSTVRTTLQALGDTISPLIIFGASNVLNAGLDYIFIYKMHFGIRGAAMATVTSMVFSFIAVNCVLIKKIYNSDFKLFLSSLKIDVKNSLRILRIGSWACIQQVARPLTGMLMFRLVLEVGGDAATSAFAIGGQLFNYTFIILSGVSTAISIMVGQSLGRKDYDYCDDIIKEGMKLAIINMILFAIPYIIFPKVMIKIFIADPGVVSAGTSYLRIVYIGLIFSIFTSIYGGVFQGAGDTFPPMVSSLTANVLLKIPIAYILAKSFNMGTNGAWTAIALSVFIEAIMIVAFFKTSKWKEKVI